MAWLLLLLGPLAICLTAVAASFGFSAQDDLAPLRVALGVTALAVPCLTAAGAAGLICRWCFPDSETRAVGIAAAIFTMLTLLASPPLLSLLGRSAPSNVTAPMILLALREASLGLGLALVAVMGTVVLVEVPLRVFSARAAQASDGSLARSVRCAASIFVTSLGWVLLEESAVERLARVIAAFAG